MTAALKARTGGRAVDPPRVKWADFLAAHARDIERQEAKVAQGVAVFTDVRPPWPDDWVQPGCNAHDGRLLQLFWSHVFHRSLLEAIEEFRKDGRSPGRVPVWIGSVGLIEVAELAGFNGHACAARLRKMFETPQGVDALFDDLKNTRDELRELRGAK